MPPELKAHLAKSMAPPAASPAAPVASVASVASPVAPLASVAPPAEASVAAPVAPEESVAPPAEAPVASASLRPASKAHLIALPCASRACVDKAVVVIDDDGSDLEVVESVGPEMEHARKSPLVLMPRPKARRRPRESAVSEELREPQQTAKRRGEQTPPWRNSEAPEESTASTASAGEHEPPWRRKAVAPEESTASMASAASTVAALLPGDWICRKCGNHNFNKRGYCNGKPGGKPCQNPRDANYMPGDWYCKCGNFNYASKQRCNRNVCGLRREEGEQDR